MKIGIAGAGLVGRLATYYLQKRDCDVTLFEGETGSSGVGRIAAGMVAPYSEYDIPTKDLLGLGLTSLECWNDIAKGLNTPSLYSLFGSLTVAFRQDHGELSHLKRRLDTVSDTISLLDSEQIQQVETEISRSDLQGFFLKDEGHVNVPEFYLQTDKLLNKKNCLIPESAISIAPKQIKTKNKNHPFDWTIDCRGLGAKDVFPQLRGVRGELIVLHAPEVNITRPLRFLHPRYPLYLVPRPNNYYILGASTVESEDSNPITVKTALELLTAVYSLHSGFSEARIVETRVGCRPAFPNNKPHIEYQPGLVRINGLYRNGYLLAPALVKEMVDVICSGTQLIKHKFIWTVHS